MGSKMLDELAKAEEEDAKLEAMGPGIVDIVWDRLDSVRHILLATFGAYILGYLGKHVERAFVVVVFVVRCFFSPGLNVECLCRFSHVLDCGYLLLCLRVGCPLQD